MVKIRFLTIPIKPVADFILARQKESLGTLVDNTVSSAINLKQMLHPMWMRIQKPLQLSSNPQVWLRLAPKSVYMTQLEGAEGEIRGSIGIKTVAETFVGEQPQESLHDSLPEFIVPGSIDSSFVMNLYSEISFEQASEITRGYLQGRSFSAGDKELIIQDITIMGIDGYPAVCVDFTGTYRGRMYVVGRMHYEPASSMLSIEDLDFDLDTKNKLQGAAAAFLHNMIIANVKPYLRYPLRERLLEFQLMIQKMLCNREIAENIFVSGSVESLSIASVTLSDRAIRAIVLAKGDLYVNIND